MQTVMNIFEEVKIGDEIYKIVNDGYYVVSNSDYQAVVSLRTMLENESENVQFINTNNSNILNETSTSGNSVINDNDLWKSSPSCRAGKNKKGTYEFSGNKKLKIRWKVGIRTFLTKRIVYAKSINFYKKSRTRAYTKVQVYGDISSDLNCTNAVTFNNFGSNNYADGNNQKKDKHAIRIQTVTQSGWVKGYHESRIKGITVKYNSTLTWN
jgi:hypothetical protein